MLDRAIEWIAPQWAAKRAYTREVMSAYRGGITTRTDKHTRRSQSIMGGSSRNRMTLGAMRDRGRRVYQDNYIGRAILDTEVDYVIGDGFTLQARTSSAEFNHECEEEFIEFLESADIRGMMGSSELQRTIYRTSRQDGDTGLVFADRGGEARVQIIPGDWVASPIKSDFNKIVDGVEISPVGRPTRFHLISRDVAGRQTSKPVPASNFKWLAWTTDPLGVRGESCYAQVFPLLDQIDGYVDAVVMAARMAAVFGLIFKEATGGKQMAGLPLMANAKGEQRKALYLENGQAKYIGNEDDIVQVQASQPMTQTPDFIRAMMRLIGLPFNQPLEIAALDGSTSNLSVLRGLRQSYMRACRPRQRKFIWSILRPMFRWWVSRRVNARLFKAAVPEDYWKHQWMPARLQLTDPISEGQGALLEFDLGINSPQNYCAELGRDYETILGQLELDRDLRKAKGLPEVRSTLTRDPLAAVAAQTPKPINGGNEDDDDEELDEDLDEELEKDPDETAGDEDDVLPPPSKSSAVNVEQVKPIIDAYGVAVRTGAISPQAEDEDSFRARLGLPPMSEAAKSAWDADHGVRRPITIAPTPTTQTQPTTPASPPASEDTDEPADQNQEE